MRTWTIVVPLYQEAARIAHTIEVLSTSALNRPGVDFVFVDDGSTDATVEVLQRALATSGLAARTLRLPRNWGKGAAVRAGVLAATGDVVAFVDADLSSPPSAVEECCRAVDRGASVVVASRGHRESNLVVRQPARREAGGKLFNYLLRRVGLTDLPDTQCGLKAFDAASARQLFASLTVRRFAFDVEILVRARLLDLEVVVLPTEWAHVAESRVAPVRDGLRMAWDALALARRLRAEPRLAGAAAQPAVDSMSSATFDVMHRVERDHWWFRAKREIVRAAITAEGVSGTAVDVGCGTGAVLQDLRAGGFSPLLGTDFDGHALRLVAGDALAGVGLVRAVAEALPLADESVDVLCSLDVVEHLDDDVAALQEYRRALRVGGRLILTVPAYNWAWSDHDVQLGHRRRYTRSQLEQVVVAAGFEVVASRYFHSWLVPIAFLLRKTPLRVLVADKPAESVSMGGSRQNAIGHRLAALDRRLGLPFGLSILLVGKRPGG